MQSNGKTVIMGNNNDELIEWEQNHMRYHVDDQLKKKMPV